MKATTASAATPTAPTFRAARFWPVIGFATLTGARSASAPALLTHFLVRHPSPALGASPLRWLQNPVVATGFKLMAVNEFIGDKRPGTPDRTSPKGLAFRAATGAVLGAAWYRANAGSVLGGAVVGTLGAVAATYLTLGLRKGLSQRLAAPIALVGVGEDALVWGAGLALVRSLAPPVV